ncbi:flagellar hook-basal body complex protein [Rhodobacterales bacterium HKCCE2091]|nr:flagellar hook-basal body complex protein [Rhodobacterales bacterium HKCCE2091]
MDNSFYTTLTRQTGLLGEMQSVANNIANISTTGFRGEGAVFAEHVATLGHGQDSLSMAAAVGRRMDMSQGGLTRTGSAYDLAIEGDGFFLVETPDGERLTRAGHFTPDANGELVTPDGYRLLDAGGAPVFVPPDARSVSVASDGTLSADGNPLTVIGLWQPNEADDLQHRTGVLFEAPGGVQPVLEYTVMQGFLEESNVNPVTEIARMIEVQRAYELGQSFLESEDERVRGFLRTVGART